MREPEFQWFEDFCKGVIGLAIDVVAGLFRTVAWLLGARK
jgi:hypothetical protein